VTLGIIFHDSLGEMLNVIAANKITLVGCDDELNSRLMQSLS
jgi:hypothetical protein